MSMQATYDYARQAGAQRIMLIMLPAALSAPQDLLESGFIDAVRDRGGPIDVVLAHAHPDYYLDGTLCKRLAADIIGPARDAQYRRIWLMGISLGGMGALLYACMHAADIEGAIVLAPYLGASRPVTAIADAGGLAYWQPPAHADDDETRLLTWLKAYQPACPAAPRLYLGYGTGDRFAPASTLLAQKLPASQVVTVDGGHDWPTWIRLWRQLLDKDPFSVAAMAARPHTAHACAR